MHDRIAVAGRERDRRSEGGRGVGVRAAGGELNHELEFVRNALQGRPYAAGTPGRVGAGSSIGSLCETAREGCTTFDFFHASKSYALRSEAASASCWRVMSPRLKLAHASLRNFVD